MSLPASGKRSRGRCDSTYTAYDAAGAADAIIGATIGATVLAIGLVGWVRGKALVNVWVWRGVHACVILGQSLSSAFAAYLAATGVIAAAALMGLLAILLIPAYIAIYRYSYRSPGLWNRTRRRATARKFGNTQIRPTVVGEPGR